MVCLCERCFEDSSDQNQQATQTAGCLGCNREHSPDTHLLIFASLCWCVGANYCVVGNWDGTGAPSAKLQLVFMALFYGVLLLTFLVSFCVWCGLEKTLKVVKDPTSSKYGVKEAAPCGVKVAGAPTEAAALSNYKMRWYLSSWVGITWYATWAVVTALVIGYVCSCWAPRTRWPKWAEDDPKQNKRTPTGPAQNHGTVGNPVKIGSKKGGGYGAF